MSEAQRNPASSALLVLTLVLIAGCGEKPAQPIAVLDLESPAGAGSGEPHLARGPDGTIVLSWLEPEHHETALRYSVLGEKRWQPAHKIAQGSDWFVNWADFPSVTPISSELWAAHWLVKRAGGTYAYDVVMALSRDAGQTWGKPITPHTDGTATEHGFVSVFPWHGGAGALWLDGRNMAEDTHEGTHASGESDAMTLRSVVIDEQLKYPALVDDLVCDCCQTDVALAADGPIAVYRNRTADEVRDIYVARTIDDQWQPGQPIGNDGWEISGCPVNGPAIAAEGSEVAVAWFTAANDLPRVRLVTSSDGGAVFSTPIDIDAGQSVGRVDVELLGDGSAAVSWLRTGTAQQGEICVQRVSMRGDAGPRQIIATTSTARLSGFPQMMRTGTNLVFAWTDTSGDAPAVKTALMEIAALSQESRAEP